ncbi:MFS transporter [Pantoea cypripedii]|uniref:MFS transporter n=1 Tax=Pantoea cypripedii TaxID=55209 RepID=A0A6B9GH51_PANCY|nr:MFS transporter [Pantoea cypripedii]QGY33319.1 MFS transporter [Pantoea cypripedii]
MAEVAVDLAVNTAQRRVSTRAAFFIAGFGMGAWAPLVPYAQQRLNLDAGTLGMLLLCLGSGSLLTMLFSGKLAGRFGCRAMITVGTIMICLSLPLLATVNSMPLMVLSLLVFGAGVGLTDVTVNIQGALVEQDSDVPLMSGFHGLFSIGGIVGSACGSLVLSSGLSPLTTSLCAIVVVAIIILFTGKHLLSFAAHEDQHTSPFRPNATLLLMAAMCMVCFLAEGSMLDWSGVWLTSERGLGIEHAGWGYAAFGCAMAVMRLSGDRIVRLLGRKALLICSGLFAMCGFAVAVCIPGWEASLVGFVLVGIGAANVAPVLTTLAGLEKTMPPNMSVAFVSTVGYLGILAGPAILGFIAHISSLSVAFLCISASLLLVLLGGMKLRFV